MPRRAPRRTTLALAAALLLPLAPRADAQPDPDAPYQTLGLALDGGLPAGGCAFGLQGAATFVEHGGTCPPSAFPGGAFTTSARIDPRGRLHLRTAATHVFWLAAYGPEAPLEMDARAYAWLRDDLLLVPRDAGAPELALLALDVFLHGSLGWSGANGALAYGTGTFGARIAGAGAEDAVQLAMGAFPGWDCVCADTVGTGPGTHALSGTLSMSVSAADRDLLRSYRFGLSLGMSARSGAQLVPPPDWQAPTWFDAHTDLGSTGGIDLASLVLRDAAGNDVTAHYDVRLANAPVAVVPEPATLALVAGGLALLPLARRGRRFRRGTA